MNIHLQRYELWFLFLYQFMQRYFCTLQVVKLAKEKAKEFEFDVEKKKLFRYGNYFK